MFRKLWKRLKRPRVRFLIPFYIFTVICIAGAITFSVVEGWGSGGFPAYIFYGLAAVTLGYTVYTVVIYAPSGKRKITEKLKTRKFFADVLENYGFKTTVLALFSFAASVAFATMYLAGALVYRLIWYGAISAYYFVLIFFRGGILLANRACGKKFSEDTEQYEKSKWRIYLASGTFLIVLEFAMTGAVTQMMLSRRPMQSGEIMAIANAAYAFYKMTMAVFNLLKARRFREPVVQSLRNLNFADACMSIVSLTVLLIATFDDAGSATKMLYVKSAVGFAACAAVIALAAYMIIKANKKLKFKKEEPEYER